MPPGKQGEWVENGKQYYLTDRNPDPNWKNQTLAWSFDKMLQYSALDIIRLLAPTPLLLIAGSLAETLQQSQAAYEKANEPKELFVHRDSSVLKKAVPGRLGIGLKVSALNTRESGISCCTSALVVVLCSGRGLVPYGRFQDQAISPCRETKRPVPAEGSSVARATIASVPSVTVWGPLWPLRSVAV